MRQSLGEYNAWVEAGKTREERASRLAEVPDDMRDQVRRHVETVFAIRKFHERKKAKKWA